MQKKNQNDANLNLELSKSEHNRLKIIQWYV